MNGKHKEQAQLDNAMKAVLGMGSVPKDVDSAEPKDNDRNRKYRIKIHRGKGKFVEVESPS